MLSDLRHALRALRRSPGFAVAAVLCLGLGLGANTTIYSLVNAMLLRPLPYAEPGRLVAIRLGTPAAGGDDAALPVPYVLDLRARSRTLGGLAAYAPRTLAFAGPEGAEAVAAMQVSGDFFSILGARPVVGRGFRASESEPGAEPVVVVAESFWRDRLAGDGGAVGRTITLDGVPRTVVGVMPDRYGLGGDRERLWIPLVHASDPARRGVAVRALGRLRSGATIEQADRELATIAARLAEEHPATDRDRLPRAEPLHERMVPGQIALVFAVMMGAVGFVLLIACANVANLLLSRTASRARELAVRAALGARRGRVVRLVLVESVLVALAGGVLGVAIAYAGTGALRAAVRVPYPAWIVIDVDARVLAYAVALSVATGLAAGLLPALRATRPALAPTLRDGSRGATGGEGARRLRDGLVVAELALSLVLLVGAALMVKSVLRLQSADPGFAPAGVLATRTYLGGGRYDARAARIDVYRRTRERVAAIPGVARAEAIDVAPLAGTAGSSAFVVDGGQVREGREPAAERRAVSAGALDLLGVRLAAGRWLTEREATDSASTAVLVGEAMARRYWPDGRAVGGRLRFVGGAAPGWLTVVGVVRDVTLSGVADAPRDVVWRPWAAEAGRWMTVLVRGAGAAAADPARLAPAMRRALGEVDAALPVREVRTMDGIVRESLWLQQLYGALFSSFAAAALVLAVVGVYGVVAYQVAQRWRELGIRVALGATRADVYRLVLGQGARLAGVGLAVGLALALAMTRVLAAVLAGVSATDPVVFAGVSAVLGGAALLAAYVPARRAMRSDPTDVLRSE